MLALLALAFVRHPGLANQYWLIGDPDPVPDLLARGARTQHPHRLCGTALARHGGVHGGWRVRRVQLRAPRAGHSAAGRVCARRRRAPAAVGVALRPAVASHQRLLPRRRHACRAVLHRLGARARCPGSRTTALRASSPRRRSRSLGFEFNTPARKYLLVLGIVSVLALAAKNMARSSIGRAWMAVRDMDVAAEVIGIRLMHTKLMAFAISSFYCGVAGALYAFAYPRHRRAGGVHAGPVVPHPVHGDHRRRRHGASARSSAPRSSCCFRFCST